MTDPCAVFVYGTLKRGQSREKCWPRKPVSIEAATLRGALFDLGPYPGLAEGKDWVAGELWQFTTNDMSVTLAALDEIEGYRSREDDEYRRVIIECTVDRKSVAAWAYRYARSAALTTARRIRPNPQGICQWRDFHP
jgi:gamma-glutamylcyclotransferase (GGCT)/AIG2-like uncharacterized protein YtfP